MLSKNTMSLMSLMRPSIDALSRPTQLNFAGAKGAPSSQTVPEPGMAMAGTQARYGQWIDNPMKKLKNCQRKLPNCWDQESQD